MPESQFEAVARLVHTELAHNPGDDFNDAKTPTRNADCATITERFLSLEPLTS